MAYTYDEFGTQIEILDEEERKRREAAAKAAGETPVVKQEVTTYQDGSQTQTTTQEIPAAPVAAPVAPEVQAPAPAMAQPAPQPQPQTRAVAPVAPDQAAYTRQQESSGRYDIGYHYKPDAQGQRKSTAFGPYGFTAAAVQDIARQDSSLNKPITEWSKEDHDRGYAIFSQKNQARLGQLGVEATPGATQLAHLLGADGAARFIKTGEVSEAAARANGGREKLIQIAQGRMAGGQAPASGAVQQPQAQAQPAPAQLAPVAPVSPEQTQQRLPGVDYSLGGGGAPGLRMPPTPAPATGQGLVAPAIQTYQAVQNDMNGLMKLATTDTAPDFIRERAREQFANLYDQQKKLKQAEDSIPKMNPRELADAMNGKNKSGIGDWLQYLLYKHVGLTDLANEKGEQLGIGHKWEQKVITDASSNPLAVQVQTSASGKVLGGNRMDGSPLTPEELGQVGSALGKGTSLSADVYVDKVTGQRYRSGYDNAGNAALINVQGGPVYRGDPKNLTLQSIGTAAAKADIRLQYEPAIAAASKGASTLAEFNAMNGTNYAIAGRDAQGLPLLVDQVSGQMLTRPAGAAGQGGVTTTTTTAAGAGGQTPAQMQSESAVNKVAREQFVKTTVPAVLEQGNNGRDIATARRQQVSIIENNPSILDIYNGSGDNYDRARNVISKLLTGVYNENNSGDFYKDVQATRLSQNERSAIEQMWNLTQGINGKTLKTNTGGGPVSNADMRTNQAANLQNFTETTPLGALQVINRSKFQGDLDTAKAAFIAKNPTLTDDVKFNSEWNKESARYTKAYEGIADARAQFLKPFAPPKDATPEQLSVFRDKVFKSFEMYPVPAFDSETNKWSYGTANAERAAAKKLLGR